MYACVRNRRCDTPTRFVVDSVVDFSECGIQNNKSQFSECDVRDFDEIGITSDGIELEIIDVVLDPDVAVDGLTHGKNRSQIWGIAVVGGYRLSCDGETISADYAADAY